MRISDWSSDVCSSDLARQPLLNDLEVEQAQKAAAEAEAQCRRAFHLERGARIVQPQLLDALAQFLEIIRVGREHAAEDDGLDFLEPRQRRLCRLFRVGHLFADSRLRAVLYLPVFVIEIYLA